MATLEASGAELFSVILQTVLSLLPGTAQRYRLGGCFQLPAFS